MSINTKAPVSKFEHNARTAARAAKAPKKQHFYFTTDRPYYRRKRKLETTSAMFTPYGFCKNKSAAAGIRKPSDLYYDSAAGLFVKNAKAQDEQGVWHHDFVPYSGVANARHTAWLADHELPELELYISKGHLDKVYFESGLLPVRW